MHNNSPETKGQEPPEQMVNPMPPVVVALFLVLLGVEVVFYLASKGIIGGPAGIGWRLFAMERFAFSPSILAWMIDTSRYPAEHMVRFLSYAFVHTGFTHAVFVGVFLLAMGKMVAEVFGALQMVVIFFASAIGGSIAYGMLAPDAPALIGGFPAVYGLIGGFTYMLWLSLSQVGANQSRAFSLIAMLMGLQLFFGLVLGGAPDWIADLAGFATGFLLSFVLAPGGWARLLHKMRGDQ
jgi:membrane associated rhomboid family serine protease